MSFFEVQCPWCLARYWTGVVGMTLMGWHDCDWADIAHLSWMWTPSAYSGGYAVHTFPVHDDPERGYEWVARIDRRPRD
jgi:hypothetical protein